jgi:NADH-quinone oxidoreductase subunit J
MQLALFIIFAALAIAGALNLLLQKHPINSALSLVVVMMSLAVLYWSLGAEFLAAAQVIVYSGAIMVLFVFVIMLLNAGEEEHTSGSRAAYFAGIPGALAVFCLLSYVFLRESHALGQAHLGGQLNVVDNLSALSEVLFTKLLLPFEVTSVLILVAILGAVVLARKDDPAMIGAPGQLDVEEKN